MVQVTKPEEGGEMGQGTRLEEGGEMVLVVGQAQGGVSAQGVEEAQEGESGPARVGGEVLGSSLSLHHPELGSSLSLHHPELGSGSVSCVPATRCISTTSSVVRCRTLVFGIESGWGRTSVRKKRERTCEEAVRADALSQPRQSLP